MKIIFKIRKTLLMFRALLLGRFLRDKNLVVVVSAHNNFTGNCKYAVMAIQERFPEKKIIWFVENEAQELTLQNIAGVVTGIRLTMDYLTKISKAKYIITDGNFMGHWLANGAIQIDFWHGIPIKKIRYDALQKEPSFVRKFLRWINKNNFIQSGSSSYNTDFLCNTSRLPLNMGRVFGTPCIAPLVNEDIFNREIDSNKNLSLLKKRITTYDKVFLYAPTFRDSGADFLEKLQFDVKTIQSACEKKNILFLIKMHPLCSLKIDIKYPNIKILDTSYDATLCIALSDVVITDYSSMYHNALAGNKDIIIMHGDIEEYRKNNRDLYEEALNDVQGHIVNDFNDICDLIETGCEIKKVPQNIVDRYWDKAILSNPYKFLEVMKK